jgi:molybdopterin-guanine dinucleotide biosynthesis protein A
MSQWRRAGAGGLILCGGRSSRMGYEKARLRFPGGSLLERTLGCMAAVADPVALSLAPGQATPALPEAVLTVKDGVANQGPLWGLAEGFRKLAPRCERLVVMPVDLPFLTPDWVARLLDEMADRRACLYEQGGYANALTAAYSLALLPKLEALVAEGKRRPIFLIEGEDARIVSAPEEAGPPGAHPLTDVDTPEAYRDALLHEGIGHAGAAEVTVDIHTPASRRNVFPAGFLALYADRAGEVLRWAQRLYPELPIAAPPGSARLLRTADAPEGTPLESDAPLWRGEHLRLELGAAEA